MGTFAIIALEPIARRQNRPVVKFDTATAGRMGRWEGVKT
jgi:hypothetical protein